MRVRIRRFGGLSDRRPVNLGVPSESKQALAVQTRVPVKPPAAKAVSTARRLSLPPDQHRMPLNRFLYIGSHVCSTLLSDPASRRRLALGYHFTSIRRTFTFELSNMLGTQNKARPKGRA
jgi:hypothetical protein